VWDILDDGSRKASSVAQKTMKRVRNAIFQSDEARKRSSTKPSITSGVTSEK
jgi:hypothetical protein